MVLFTLFKTISSTFLPSLIKNPPIKIIKKKRGGEQREEQDRVKLLISRLSTSPQKYHENREKEGKRKSARGAHSPGCGPLVGQVGERRTANQVTSFGSM